MLNELNGLQLGPIYLSFRIISLIIGITGAYSLFSFLVKRSFPEKSEKIINALQISGLLFLLIYKFTPLIMHPSYLLSPSKLLVYSGGPLAFELASLVGIIYFGYFFVKEKWSIKLLDHLVISTYAYLIVDSMLLKKVGLGTPFSFGYELNEILFHPVNFYYLLMYTLFLVTLVYSLPKQKPGVLALLLIISYFFTQSLIRPFV